MDFSNLTEPVQTQRDDWWHLLPHGMAIVTFVALFFAARSCSWKGGELATLVIVGSLAVLFTLQFGVCMVQGDRPRVVVHWGGFGGGLGGWRLSRALTYYLLAIIFNLVGAFLIGGHQAG